MHNTSSPTPALCLSLCAVFAATLTQAADVTVCSRTYTRATTNINRAFTSCTGTIPSFAALSQLEELDLSHNQLTGTVPSFANNVDLEYLVLSYNALTGTVPSFANNTQLLTITLEHNYLTGIIPSFANNVWLRYLRLANNRMTGTIHSFATFKYLQDLYLADNMWSCPILDYSSEPNNDYSSSMPCGLTLGPTFSATTLSPTAMPTDAATLRVTHKPSLPSTLLPSTSATAPPSSPPTSPPTLASTLSPTQCRMRITSVAVSPHAALQTFSVSREEYDVSLPHDFRGDCTVRVDTSDAGCDTVLLNGVAVQSGATAVVSVSGSGLSRAVVSLAAVQQRFVFWLATQPPPVSPQQTIGSARVQLTLQNVPPQYIPKGVAGLDGLRHELANSTSDASGRTYAEQLVVSEASVAGQPCSQHLCPSSQVAASVLVSLQVLPSDQADANSVVEVVQRLMGVLKADDAIASSSAMYYAAPVLSTAYNVQDVHNTAPGTQAPTESTSLHFGAIIGIVAGAASIVVGVVKLVLMCRSHRKDTAQLDKEAEKHTRQMASLQSDSAGSA